MISQTVLKHHHWWCLPIKGSYPDLSPFDVYPKWPKNLCIYSLICSPLVEYSNSIEYLKFWNIILSLYNYIIWLDVMNVYCIPIISSVKLNWYIIKWKILFQVLTDPKKGLLFQNLHDRKQITVDPLAETPGSNTTRTIIYSKKYDHIVLYDHIVRRKT